MEEETSQILTAEEESNIRLGAWQVWLSIGTEATSAERVERNPPTQHFLTALMQIFPDVFLPIKSKSVFFFKFKCLLSKQRTSRKVHLFKNNF